MIVWVDIVYATADLATVAGHIQSTWDWFGLSAPVRIHVGMFSIEQGGIITLIARDY